MNKNRLHTNLFFQGYPKWILLVVLLVFGILVAFYSWQTPPFEGSDAAEHYAYIKWLADGKGFPPQGDAAWDTPMRQEASQPPLYYLLASIPFLLVDQKDGEAEYRPNPHFPTSAPGMTPDNKNVAIHYPSDTNPLHGGWLALYMARGVSLLFGILLLVCVYGLASQVRPGNNFFALATTIFVALIPQVLFISAVLSNDMAAAATSALTLWLLVLNINKGPSGWRGLALGGAFGLAALTKVSALSLGLPIALGVIWLWWSHRNQRRELIRMTAAIVLASILVAGWWYLRTWVIYGSPLGLSTHFQASWAVSSINERILPGRAWLEVFYSFWVAFGWGNIKFPGWTYTIIGFFVLLSTAGLLLSGRRWWRDDRRLGNRSIIMLLLLLTVLVVSVALEAWMQRVTAPHGRLLFPAMAAIAVLLVSGWWAVRPWLVSVALAGLFILAIISPILLLHPAYAYPKMLSAEQLSPIIGTEPRGLRFGEIAELQGVILDQKSATAGEVLPVQVCWRTLAEAEKDYSVLVHLVGPNNSVVASRHTYPGLGSYPTSLWEPGQLFCDQINIDIPEDLLHTLRYRVEIGIFDTQTGERLPPYDLNGDLLTHTFIDDVRLQSADMATLAQPPGGDDTIRLVSADYAEQWQPGSEQIVTLRWWAAGKMDQDYTVFIHLRDRSKGENVAQGDGPPVDGWYPTSSWTAEEIVDDSHTFSLPEDIPPGVYDLVVGWYDPASGLRLGMEHLLAMIEVKP